MDLLADYPESAPVVTIMEHDNLDGDRESQLKDVIDLAGEECRGMEMLFTIASEVQMWLETNNSPVLSMFDAMTRPKADTATTVDDLSDDMSDDRLDEEPEFKGLNALPVIPEKERMSADSFYLWRDKFAKEMIQKGIWPDPLANAGKTTGRIYFEEAANSNLQKATNTAESNLLRVFGEDIDDLDFDSDDLGSDE
ncbi:MAG: uncharacterized protein KVP18_004368 [Porospora cf. gigantea A]|uniref:uncharacterized protein n=2 Tax=Porospora cf. gigantea A TaxID=2853593 RepID=UPI00355A72D7|nr:MAG: hypothetical protein KVP18_004368 [Porospora cf. gigantea A]